jgi:NADH-quinone oxidoreductase subunit E
MSKSEAFGVKFDKVCGILDKYGHNPHMLITILQEIQAEYSYLPEDIMTYVATALGISPGQVFGAATFYAHFTLEPKGKFVIRVCDGTACHVKKSSDIIKSIQKDLKLSAEKRTTDDMLFTLEMVACLGACGLAPVVVVNEDVHGAMNGEKSLKILADIREAEKSDGK